MGSTSYAGSVVVPNKGWVIYGFNSEDSTDARAPIISNFFSAIDAVAILQW